MLLTFDVLALLQLFQLGLYLEILLSQLDIFFRSLAALRRFRSYDGLSQVWRNELSRIEMLANCHL